jgi:hypothetical protein
MTTSASHITQVASYPRATSPTASDSIFYDSEPAGNELRVLRVAADPAGERDTPELVQAILPRSQPCAARSSANALIVAASLPWIANGTPRLSWP